MVGREVLTEVVALCGVAGEHLLVVGPPGTAKSEAVRRVAQQLGGRYFEYLLGRFTEPNEVFGCPFRGIRELRFQAAAAMAGSGSHGLPLRAAVMASRAVRPWAVAESR